jgi:hypothetical protein
MLTRVPLTVRIFLHTEATDMRKGFDGLVGLVQQFLAQDPLSGHLFLFFNRRRDRVKALYWDGDGLAVWYKRLESGTFEKLNPAALAGKACGSTGIELTATELGLFLGGIDLASARRRKRYARAVGSAAQEIRMAH